MTSLKKNLILPGCIILGLSAVLIISVLGFMNSLYYDTTTKALVNTAHTLFAMSGEDDLREFFSNGNGDNNDEDFSQLLESIQDAGIFRLTLIDTSGDVLWDSSVEGRMVNHSDRSEVRTALGGLDGVSRRQSISTGMKQIYAAIPVYGNNGVIGVFRLSCTVPGFWKRIAPVALSFISFSVFIIITILSIIAVFYRSVSVSLKRLSGIALNASGEGLYREPYSGIAVSADVDEIITLENALLGMEKELKNRIEQAKDEGLWLQAILNGMSEAVFALDGNLKIKLANPQARSLFHIDDRIDLSLLQATRSAELETAAGKVLSEGKSQETEFTLRTGNIDSRAEQLFRVFIGPLANPVQKQPDRGVIIVMEDITRLARLEKVRKDFVANVSHELRTPIQLIKGFSETIMDTSPDEFANPGNREQFLHCMEIIRKNAGTMENLTNDLLILASLENGDKNRPEMNVQPLSPLLAEAVSSVEVPAGEKKITITVDCSADLQAKVHGPFIIQALINLLDNAVKYSQKKSQVWVRAYSSGQDIVFEVQDNGIGIPAVHLGRLFERFYRADKAHSRESGGTGLGLSIVRHIALLHNGTAEVESYAGEGSIFRIKIPG